MCQNYASAEPMLPASIRPVQAQSWHTHQMFTKIKFTIHYLITYPAIMISFDKDIFGNYLHIQLIVRTTYLTPYLHFMALGWFWSSITGRGNVEKVTDRMWPLCLCPRHILNSHLLFKAMMIRLKIVGHVKYTRKIAHIEPVSSSNWAVKLKIVKYDPVNVRPVRLC